MEKNNLTREELDGIYTFAIDLTRRAGKLLLEGAERRYGDAENRGVVEAHLEKENAVDLVTKMDEGMFCCLVFWWKGSFTGFAYVY